MYKLPKYQHCINVENYTEDASDLLIEFLKECPEKKLYFRWFNADNTCCYIRVSTVVDCNERTLVVLSKKFILYELFLWKFYICSNSVILFTMQNI